ncbi:GNAT family N-acetyltransferase, partial [Streptomyces sp. NPDC056682]|uniref:GNAT family N-acetyltransferase n=1 Tax=Streptomyces sp. NPDC056682 TaxID=3345909 RepID=UPI0036A6B1D3
QANHERLTGDDAPTSPHRAITRRTEDHVPHSHKCLAAVLAHNEASLALFRGLGFTEEGRLREHVFFAGRHHDLVMMGMLVNEFDRRHTMSEP